MGGNEVQGSEGVPRTCKKPILSQRCYCLDGFDQPEGEPGRQRVYASMSEAPRDEACSRPTRADSALGSCCASCSLLHWQLSRRRSYKKLIALQYNRTLDKSCSFEAGRIHREVPIDGDRSAFLIQAGQRCWRTLYCNDVTRGEDWKINTFIIMAHTSSATDRGGSRSASLFLLLLHASWASTGCQVRTYTRQRCCNVG